MNDVAAATDGIAASVPPAAERRLSFAFAKRHGVLVKGFNDGVAECACRDNASPLAIAEVRRARAAESDRCRDSLRRSHGTAPPPRWRGAGRAARASGFP